MALNELDTNEFKLLHPIASKVKPGEWLKIFFFDNNPLKIWLRAGLMGASIVWIFLRSDIRYFIILLFAFLFWDLTSMVYWRRRALHHRDKLEKVADEMLKVNKEIQEKQKYFERKKEEYLREHPEEKTP